MVDFNNEMPKGRPQLPADYWSKNINNENSFQDVNTNFTLKDLKDISVFNGKKQ